MLAVADAQETRRLLESLTADSRHILERRAGLERSVRLPVLGNRAGNTLRDTGNVAQHVRAGGVELHPDRVDAGDNRVGEARIEQFRIHVMLILPHSDGLRLYLHELRERVHEPAADGYRAADRDVLLGKLRPGDGGGGVDRGSGFVHRDDGDPRGTRLPLGHPRAIGVGGGTTAGRAHDVL